MIVGTAVVTIVVSRAARKTAMHRDPIIRATLPLLRSGAEGWLCGFFSPVGGKSATFSSDEVAVLASLGFSDNGSPTLVSVLVAPGPAAVASATPSSFSA